jgi:hypothetical protein
LRSGSLWGTDREFQPIEGGERLATRVAESHWLCRSIEFENLARDIVDGVQIVSPCLFGSSRSNETSERLTLAAREVANWDASAREGGED